MSSREQARRIAFAMEVTDALAASPLATVVTDPQLPDNPIIAVNSAFERLTGYAGSEAKGRNCRFLSGPHTAEHARARLREAVAAERATVSELLNYRADGSAFHNAVVIAPVRDARFDGVLFIGTQVEVTAPRHDAASSRREEAIARVSRLSPRQRQVLHGMVDGLRNKQIAERLHIDEKTVKMHRAALLVRLEAPTSADALRWGVEAGLDLIAFPE